MAGNIHNDLVSALRGKLSDDRASTGAFSLAVTANAKSALLELTNGFLIVTVESGEAVDSLRLNLLDPQYASVGKLFSSISKKRGYAVVADTTMHQDHPSNDLRVDGMQQIAAKSSYTLKHHIWSEHELSAFLVEACALHNPNYANLTQVPRNEHPFVLMKAQSAAYRALAADSSRRKGMETDANTLLRLANDLESQYTRDLTRLARVVPVAKSDESKMGFGDAVMGSLVRRSLRAGYMAPQRPAGATTPPHVYDAADDDVEDTIARIRWAQSREVRFSYYELWRDTQAKVERCISGRLDQSGTGTSFLSAGTQYTKSGTSKQVLGVGSGSSPTFDGFFFWTAAELAGANVTMATFIDGTVQNNPAGASAQSLGAPLEPDTEYYYRLYSVDFNGEILPSEVKKIRTKTMRAKVSRDASGALIQSAIVPQTGPLAGGTSIAIVGTGFVAGTTVLVNGKDAAAVINSLTSMTCTSPAFTNADWIGRQSDIVIVSPNGLRDIVIRGWKFT